VTVRKTFSYLVIRYVPDLVTGEFLNVGLILHARDERLLCYRTRKTFTRLKGAFPHFEKAAFKSAMEAVDRALEQEKKGIKIGLLPTDDTLHGDYSPKIGIDASTIASRVLMVDECLQTSPMGTGSSTDPTETFERFFERLVAAHDGQQPIRKSEEDVWRPVRTKLEERKLASKLVEKRITGKVDDFVFKHAWKNGQWHVYEPVSFDLADEDSIKQKARRVRGHLDAVTEGTFEPFKAHFIAGAPTKTNLMPAYQKALAIISGATLQPEVFEEKDVDTLVDRIEDDVRAHRDTIFD